MSLKGKKKNRQGTFMIKIDKLIMYERGWIEEKEQDNDNNNLIRVY